jgi:hypothetical protein
MLRKVSLALAATAALAAVALAPTSASAWGRGWGWGAFGAGVIGSAIVANNYYAPYYGYGYGYSYDGCLRRRVVNTYNYGPVVRWVNVCY